MMIFNRKNLFIFDKSKKIMPAGLFICFFVFSILGFSTIAYGATNINSWYDKSTQEIQEFEEVYNDGDIQITTKVEACINPVNGEVTSSEVINVKNLNDKLPIEFNSVKLHKYKGFETAKLANWKLATSGGLVLFEGDESTDFDPAVSLKPGESGRFKVSTNLTGQDALELRDTTPFEFVYEYEKSEPYLNYQVCIWGIEEDRVFDNHHNAGLSFGPAIGKTSDCLEVDGHESHAHGKHCIHEDSWEEIIENCNEGNWWIYSDCLAYGCTKTIRINASSEMFNTSIISEPSTCSAWSPHVKSTYNLINAWCNDTDPECANYVHSRLRATFNGYDEAGADFTPSVYAYQGVNDCLTSENCALSCFPEILQENIVPKYFRAQTFWDPKDLEYPILGYEDICDKLWAPNCEEIWGDWDIDLPVIQWWDEQYTKTKLLGVTHSSERDNVKCYNEYHTAESAWTCQPHRYFNYKAFSMGSIGIMSSVRIAAIDPFFCLGSKEIGLDNYNLESLNNASFRIEQFSDLSPYYDEFYYYMKNDEIWWSNSNGYFKEKGFNYTSSVTDEDVANCNQAYINNFKDSSGKLASQSNRFVFLRVVGLNDDFYEYESSKYNKRGITFQFVHALPCAYDFDSSQNRRWSDSTIRKTLNGEVYSMLCQGFRNFICQRKTFGNYARSSTWNASLSDDKIYLPSYSEMWAIDKDTDAAPYSWYDNGRDDEGNIIFNPESTTDSQMECNVKTWNWINKISGSARNVKLKYLAYCNDGSLPSNKSFTGCWLRSGDCENNSNYFCIDQNGYINSKQKYDSKLSVAPCFCLGVGY